MITTFTCNIRDTKVDIDCNYKGSDHDRYDLRNQSILEISHNPK